MADFVLNRVDDIGFSLVVCAGQSNMAGRGTAFGLTTDPLDSRVYQYGATGAGAGAITIASEPLLMAESTTSGMGPALVFGRWWASRLPNNRRVLLVPAAYGGTPLSSASGPLTWRPSVSGGLFDQSIAQTQAALVAAGDNARVEAVLWLQGETDGDGNHTGPTYQTDLDALIDGYRSQLSLPNLPFVLGQMVPDYLSTGTRAAINAVHIDTPRRKLYTGFAYGLAGTAYNNADGNHYNAPAQRILGRRFLSAYHRALLNVTGAAPLIPAGVTATQTGSTVTAVWKQPAGRVTDFNVRYSTNGGTSWTALTRAQSIDAAASITGLTAPATVSVQVQTVNEQGVSAWSTAGSVTLVYAPNAATSLALGTLTATTAPLTWAASATDSTHGAPISYTVQYKKHSDSTWTTFSTTTATATTVTGLASATSYDFQVLATNAAGTATSATVTATSAAGAIYVADTFTRANSSVGLGTAETGGAWAAYSGVFGISSNQAYTVSGSNSVAWINSGQADCIVSAAFAVLSTTAQARLVFRGDGSTTNYWCIQNRATVGYVLYKVTGGSFAQVGGTLGTATAGDVVAVTLSGSSISVKLNGTVVYSGTDTYLQSNTWHGIGAAGFDSATRMDNFQVVGQ